MSVSRALPAVAVGEWRAMLRNQVAVAAGILMLALTLVAIVVSHERVTAVNAERARFQSTVDAQWANQPDRHPHRVVHYGHYVFRPLSPLAFFDFGVDPFTGSTLFLEGHRQNSANFSDAAQSSVLLRFGQLTPAFVLQVLTPLLIVFLAFGSVARERERGQLRLQIVQGVRGATLLLGKLAAHAGVALLLGAPAFIALVAIAVMHPAVAAEALALLAGYALYLVVWVVAAVLVSASLPRARDALLALVAGWIVTAILLPRVMPDIAAGDVGRPSRIETEVAIHERLAKIGDTHNPDDPYFKAFRARTLEHYGVTRVEDLPVNYSGLSMAEGERMTSALFDEFMRADYARQTEESAIVHSASVASPLIALRRMSTALSGTNLDSHARFLLEGERYRYAFVQRLNGLHVNVVTPTGAGDERIDKHHWEDTPRFGYAPAPFADVAARHAWPAFALLGGWLLALCAIGGWVAKRLERNPA
jgi:ABC-2 type transport system permease protein